MSVRRGLSQLLFASCVSVVLSAAADTLPRGSILHLDFSRGAEGMRLMHGAKHVTGSFGGAIEFTAPLQYAETDFARKLDGAQAATIGGWFYVRRAGEGTFLLRGQPQVAPLGERTFRPAEGW